jgi:hypothetical protein
VTRRRQFERNTLSREVGLGQRGINLVERLVTAMGSQWNPTIATQGSVDGTIELFEPGTRRATGLFLSVQCIAVTAFDGDRIALDCRPEEIASWLETSPPVILVVCCPDSGEAYWMPTRAYFGEDPPSGPAILDRRTQALTPRSYPELLEAARPEPQRAQVVRAIEAAETLYSNLVPLRDYPYTVYVARALVSSYREAWARLKEVTDRVVTPAWTLDAKEMFSFVDPSSGPLARLVDPASVEGHDARDFANAIQPSAQRRFAQLLAGALRDDLGAAGVRYFEKDEVYAFKGKPEEKPRTYKYDNLDRPTTVTVVAHYVSPAKDGREQLVLRHHAFEGGFRRLGAAWYLEVRPTYRFTTDGSHKYKLHGERLAFEQRLEGNRDVLAQMLLWNDVLTRASRPGIAATTRRLLQFGPSLQFRIERSVPDYALVPFLDPQPRDALDADLHAKEPGA